MFEKLLSPIILLVFLQSSSFSQKIYGVDELNEPIFNVSFYTSDLIKSSFSNLQGEVDLSIFKENDSINIQHPSFKKLVILKNKINQKIILESLIIEIDEVVISVNRWKENLNEVTNKNLLIDRNLIEKTSPQTSGDLLEKTGEIYLQKSQLGGGSPMIRGFSANRILLSIDGIRLNNIILYGSDAIGGGINFEVIDPTFKLKKLITGSQNIQYNSSNNSKIYNLNIELGNKNISNISSISVSSYDDLKTGSKRNKYPNFGLREEFVVRDDLNDNDIVIQNQNPNKQVESGYSQLNLINKTNFKINDNKNVIYGIYYSKSSDIPR